MRLQGIYRPTLNAQAIEALVRKHLANKKVQGKNNEQVALEVTNLHTRAVHTLHVTFFTPKKGGLLHGRTTNGEHVFIKLGEKSEQAVRHPSVVVSISEKTPKESTNTISKRR